MPQPLDPLWQDVRFAARSLRRARGVTAIALLTLAAGIAAVTLTFSFLNAAIFRPMPFPGAEHMVAIGEENGRYMMPFSDAGPATAQALRQPMHSFERVSAYRDEGALLTVGERARIIAVTDVDSGLFALLGVRPQAGRVFSAEEVRERAPLVVISDHMWRGELGRAKDVMGKTIRLGDKEFTIIGVMPQDFGFANRSTAEAWVPMDDRDATFVANGSDLALVGKLRAGVSIAQARSEVKAIGQGLAISDPAYFKGKTLVVFDDMVFRLSRAWKPVLLIFLGAAACLLLIACANVGNLLLMRAVERRAEMAVRVSLGAGRWRIARQLLTESALLGIAATALGAALTVWFARLSRQLVLPANMEWRFQLTPDARVLAFVMGIAFVAIVLVGLTPAVAGTQFALVQALKGDGGATSTRTLRHGRLGVVVQVALSVVLVLSATLLGVTYRGLSTYEKGYHPERVVTAHVFVDYKRYPDAASRSAMDHGLLDALQRLTGVVSTARESSPSRFLAAGTPALRDFDLYRTDDATASVERSLGVVQVRKFAVSDGYFETLGIPIMQGRMFAPTDSANTSVVAVVTGRVARGLWPAGQALGKTFRIGRNGPVVTVVGVTGDIRESTNGQSGIAVDALAHVYLSERQATGPVTALLVRAAGAPEALAGPVGDAIRRMAPEASAFSAQTPRPDPYAAQVKQSGTIIAACAVLALLFSCVGVYAVTAYSVVQRTREIGIRMALGGTVQQVRNHLIGGSMALTAAGVVIGICGAAAVAELYRTMLWGVSPVSPVVYAGVCALFGAVSFVACWLPSRRATRVDPMTALRGE